MNRNNIQAIEQILAKFTLINRFLNLQICCSNNTDVDFACNGLSYPLKCAFL